MAEAPKRAQDLIEAYDGPASADVTIKTDDVLTDEEIEDAAAVDAALSEGGEPIPLEQVMKDLGLSEVVRPDQADVIREAIAFVAGVPEDSVEIALEPVVDPR